MSEYPYKEKNIKIKKKVFEKNIKPIEQLQKKTFEKGYIGFGHNRWATHGQKTIKNAHPHISNDESICLVHNGIIENFKELKLFLIQKNFTFYSDTDTEVIVNLLQYYNQKYKMEFESIIQMVIQEIKGTFAFIIFYKNNPNRLYCVRRGSPLLVSNNETRAMIVSEQSAFSDNVKTFIVLKNDGLHL